MSSTLSPSEEAQLGQTIEMFEVITQSQPQDYQSLEILKEAYSKLGRQKEVISTSKRIAQAYVQMGQLSSAILEYETILQRFPDDPDVQAALLEIESKANNFPMEPAPAAAPVTIAAEPQKPSNGATQIISKNGKSQTKPAVQGEVDDGRKTMRKIFESPEIPPLDDRFVKGLEGRGLKIMRKSGWWENWFHDTAVVTGGRRHYILVALTHHAKGDDYLVELARAVDDLMTGSGTDR